MGPRRVLSDYNRRRVNLTCGGRTLQRSGAIMFELWVSVALLGLWSCVGVIYRNSRRSARQMDDVVRLLTDIAAKT